MQLTWHIVRKDLRRLWPWLTLLLATIIIRYVFGWHIENHLRPGPILLRNGEITARMLLGLQLLVGALLTAQLIHEDTPDSDRAFWLTRPIHGLRLFAAKTISLLLMLGLIPLLAVLGWWWLHDFRPCEVAAALPEFAARQGALIAASFAVALFTQTTTGFIFTAVCAAIVLWLQIAADTRWTARVSDSTALSQGAFCLLLIATAVIACAWLKYTRRLPFAPRVILLATALTGSAVGAWWPVVLLPLLRGQPNEPAAAATIGLRHFTPPTFTQNSAALAFAFTQVPPRHLIDVRDLTTRLVGNETALPLPFSSLGFSPIHTATAQASHDPLRAPFQYMYRLGFDRPPFPVSALELIPRTTLRRVDTVAELPLEIGASQQTGPYRTRITQISSSQLSRSVNLLSVFPARLCAPGTGLSEPQSKLLLSAIPGVLPKPFRTRRIFLSGNQRLPLDNVTHQSSLQIDHVRYVFDVFHYTPIADADPTLDRLVHATYPLLGEFKRTLTTPLSQQQTR